MDTEYIYETLLGERVDPCPGIENAFSDGMRCAELYEEIYQAKMRLCERLGTEEDPDVELLISNFFDITRELSMKMFRYGQQFPKCIASNASSQS